MPLVKNAATTTTTFPRAAYHFALRFIKYRMPLYNYHKIASQNNEWLRESEHWSASSRKKIMFYKVSVVVAKAYLMIAESLA